MLDESGGIGGVELRLSESSYGYTVEGKSCALLWDALMMSRIGRSIEL